MSDYSGRHMGSTWLGMVGNGWTKAWPSVPSFPGKSGRGWFRWPVEAQSGIASVLAVLAVFSKGKRGRILLPLDVGQNPGQNLRQNPGQNPGQNLPDFPESSIWDFREIPRISAPLSIAEIVPMARFTEGLGSLGLSQRASPAPRQQKSQNQMILMHFHWLHQIMIIFHL